MVLELLLDVLEMLLELLDLSWRSWTCPGGPGGLSAGPKAFQTSRFSTPGELQTIIAHQTHAEFQEEAHCHVKNTVAPQES